MENKENICSFCEQKVENLDVNSFIICFDKHKEIAKNEEAKFFKEYPDYTKWNEVPKGRLIFK
jgi:RNA polymerase subunit RPABC4/transcription elongation factor Spt4